MNLVDIKTVSGFIFAIVISIDRYFERQFLGIKKPFGNIFANKNNEFTLILIYIFMFSQLIYNCMSSIKSKILFMGSSFSSTHASSPSSSESSSSSFLDTKKEWTSVFSVTAKLIESTSSLRGSINAKGFKRSSPFVPFIKASLINIAYQPLEVISLSDDLR